MVIDWPARAWLWYLSIINLIGGGAASVIGLALGWEQPPWITPLMLAGTVGFLASIELKRLDERLLALEADEERPSMDS